MRLLTHTLCLALALSYSVAHDIDADEGFPKRCDGIEFDGVTASEKGVPFFIKGDHLWKGFEGGAELFNGSFKEVDDHPHLGTVDAAFRFHSEDEAEHHDHIFFFLDDKIFSFYNHTLEAGYPKDIGDVFPGVPSDLDAAVECPTSECGADSVIFFKGDEVFHYDIKTKKIEEKEWAHLPNCTSAFRWLGHYYCFHGQQFTKFHPVSGVVMGKYPKDTRGYFMSCGVFDKEDDHTEREKCSRAGLDAVTSDEGGSTYAFRGHYYLHRDNDTDSWEASTIDSSFKELHSHVDAAFSYKDDLFIIKDTLIYSYKEKDFALVDGYPKPVKDVLGIEGHVDAAFVCKGDTVYVLQGREGRTVDLSISPIVVGEAVPLHFLHVDAAMCGATGVKVVIGSHFYEYESPFVMIASKMLAEPHRVSMELLGCDH